MADGAPLRFLFVTLGHIETSFYARVGDELTRHGHDVVHLTYSRRAAHLLAEQGISGICLADRMSALDPLTPEELAQEADAVAQRYETPTLRDIYRTDFVCDGRPEPWSVERTVRHLRAVEQVFDEVAPDVVVPEVGNETIRTAAHLVALRRKIPTLFLFYTIFPRPLRLYIDTMDAPIVAQEEVRPLNRDEEAEVEAFVTEFQARDAPIRAYRSVDFNQKRVRTFARHVINKLRWDADNPYLRPGHWLIGNVREVVRGRFARRYYQDPPASSRPYLYFPLHMVDDYKLKRVIPHCADQLAIIEQVARALPHGHDLVVKEHPMSIGRNRLGMLSRLRGMRNVRLVAPRTSSQQLIAGSAAVVVISSTVGLEALLFAKPVMTFGRPFYSGYGITRDMDGLGDVRHAIPALLEDRPDPVRIRRFLHAAMRACYPGAPVLVDRSDENARVLAASLDEVGRQCSRSGP